MHPHDERARHGGRQSMTTSTDTLSRHWISGAWQEGSGSIAVVNPATEETIAEVPAGGASEIDTAVVAARHAFRVKSIQL
jgi:aldehyde dehydrogenase (NAD+)